MLPGLSSLRNLRTEERQGDAQDFEERNSRCHPLGNTHAKVTATEGIGAALRGLSGLLRPVGVAFKFLDRRYTQMNADEGTDPPRPTHGSANGSCTGASVSIGVHPWFSLYSARTEQ